MSKHTKGPWKAIYGYPYGIIIQANGKRIANTSPTNKNWEADGKLLATALELLEVCKSILTDYGYDSSIRKQLEEVIAKI